MNVNQLGARGEALLSALGREYYLTGAGRKATPAFEAIYEQYADLQSDEALACARGARVPALVEWVVDLRVGRAVAPYEERQLVWERRARIAVSGRDIPYLRAAIELQNSPDRAWRIALDRARAAAGATDLNELRRDRFLRERETVAAAGFGADYPAAITAVSGIDLEHLAGQADRLLADTADLYREGLRHLVRRRLGVPPDQLVRADTGWAFRADEFDAAFPGDQLLGTATAQMREMGLDAFVGGRVRVDAEEREGKQPRAFCVPVRVPDEVYLVLRPHGGHADYRTFWHELGHAMHFGSVDRDRSFVDRWLGDMSVTEAFAMLWDHLTLEEGWLQRFTELGRESGAVSRIAQLRVELAVSELYLLRRYAGKLRYELELHRSEYGAAMGERYAERLTAATGFRFLEEDHLRDVDPGFYVARYLRAWQLEGTLAQILTERYERDWYRNPRAGGFVQDLMRRGQAEPADRLAAEFSAAPLSFDASVSRLAAVLA